jgi:hypothetical protein
MKVRFESSVHLRAGGLLGMSKGVLYLSPGRLAPKYKRFFGANSSSIARVRAR